MDQKKKAYEFILQEINIPIPLALFIIICHLVVLISPLALNWVAYRYNDYIQTHYTYPFMLHAAAGMFYIGGAFEIAQNNVDKWYITCSSYSLVNYLFYFFIASGQAILTLASAGNIENWITAISVISAVVIGISYLFNIPSYIFLLGTTLPSCYGIYKSGGDPAVFLSPILSIVGATFFFGLLIKTRAQILHSGIVLFIGIQFLIFPWAIANSAQGKVHSWDFVIYTSLAIFAMMAILYYPLSKLKATVPRIAPPEIKESRQNLF